MSHTVGIRELKQQTSAVLRRVVSGEEIEITDHGHRIARLVPVMPSALDQLLVEGRATPAEGELLDLARQAGLPVARDSSPSGALADIRADER